jgi:DNA mismatch endonuclease (patch repair protein)
MLLMKGNRGKDTKPEQQVRSLLHRSGMRFRKHARPLRPLRCQADIVFPREKIAVFIDGCFWHHCPEHGHVPGSNSTYWREKLERNVTRDRRNSEALGDAGWLVLRYWEHVPPSEVATQVRAQVLDRRSSLDA